MTKNLFDEKFPHLSDWILKEGNLTFSLANFSFITCHDKYNCLVWADFRQFPTLDEALKGLNLHLASLAPKSDEKTDFNTMDFLESGIFHGPTRMG